MLHSGLTAARAPAAHPRQAEVCKRQAPFALSAGSASPIASITARIVFTFSLASSVFFVVSLSHTCSFWLFRRTPSCHAGRPRPNPGRAAPAATPWVRYMPLIALAIGAVPTRGSHGDDVVWRHIALLDPGQKQIQYQASPDYILSHFKDTNRNTRTFLGTIGHSNADDFYYA